MDLAGLQDQMWQNLQKDVRQLRQRVSRNELHEQAQVGRSAPIYANFAALPTGAFSHWGCTEDTKKLYWHNGTTWKEVSLL